MATISTTGSLSIGYKGKMFTKPKCEYQLDHVIPEGESPEETDLLKKAFTKLFDQSFEKLAKKREKSIKSAMENTEAAISKKPPSNMDKFVETANKLIQQGVDVWRQVEVPKLAQDCIEKCYDYMEKKLKKKINRQKVKTVLKVVALVLIVVIVAAASIAANVLTGGIAAIVVGTAILTGARAMYTSTKTIKEEYINYSKFLEKIEKDYEGIKNAILYLEKKSAKVKGGGKLGPKEKVKLLLNGSKVQSKSLIKYIKSMRKQLDMAEARLIIMRKKQVELIVTVQEAEDNWKLMASHADAKISAEAKKAQTIATATRKSLEKFTDMEKKFRGLKKIVIEQMYMIENKGEFEGGKVTQALSYARDHKDSIKALAVAATALRASATLVLKAI